MLLRRRSTKRTSKVTSPSIPDNHASSYGDTGTCPFCIWVWIRVQGGNRGFIPTRASATGSRSGRAHRLPVATGRAAPWYALMNLLQAEQILLFKSSGCLQIGWENNLPLAKIEIEAIPGNKMHSIKKGNLLDILSIKHLMETHS